MIAWHKADKTNRMYCNLKDNKKISMPRYYKQKIYHELERKAIGVAVRKKQLEKLALAEADPMYYHNKFQSHKQAFKKMQLDNTKNEKL